jgi:hydrogenase maturation factor HypF (carbamoyltransferase family)
MSGGDLDRELEALAQGVRQKRRGRFVFGMGLVVAAVAAVAVSAFAGKVKEAEAAQAEAVAARIAEQDRIAQLNLQLEERNRKISELTVALDAAKSDAEKAQKAFAAYKATEETKALAGGEDEATAKTSKLKTVGTIRGRAATLGKAVRGASAAVSAKKSGKCVCKQGDPLCGCL